MVAKRKKVSDIGVIRMGYTIPFWSDGAWSMHELLEYVLEFTGRSKVLITAFSINEESIRALLNLKSNGLIYQLDCLFNTQITRFKADLLPFVENIADSIRLAPCHAKVFIIEGAFRVCVIASANMTNNLRYEAGVICADSKIIDNFIEEVYKSYNKATPLDYA